ncbi:MAG: tripartite tricarboxylate transporter substrate-binding protein, partial [Pseudomonadota bacterium]|nr:tripartite tricarboxylate transporter substrate-binding protein [Pseudomonadota bacterium]
MTIRKVVLSSLTTLALATSGYSMADYPSKDIQGIIMWGAGGSTDSVMRSVTPYAEEKLGVDVIMTNRSGGVGAIATKYVYSQKSDGYTLLMGAENPQMHKVLGLSP